MLTGGHLFLADTIPETLAHVMTRQIDLGTMPASTPCRIRDLLARCLEKDPKKRLRDIGEARIRLEEVISGAAEEATSTAGAIAAAPAGSRTRERIAWGAAAAFALLAVVAATWALLPRATPPETRLGITTQSVGPLRRVPAQGGAFADVTKLAPEQTSHRWPHFLPGGRQFLFYVQGASAGLYLGSLDSPDSKRIAVTDTNAQFVAPDWLLFLRQGTLTAQRVDLARGELTGEPVSVADQVMANAQAGAVPGRAPGGGVSHGAGQRGSLAVRRRPPDQVHVRCRPRDVSRVVSRREPDCVQQGPQGSIELPLDGKQQPSVFLKSKFEERAAQFSPDGRWVGYASDESGQSEIYLRPFAASSSQFPVSTTGGIKK